MIVTNEYILSNNTPCFTSEKKRKKEKKRERKEKSQ